MFTGLVAGTGKVRSLRDGRLKVGLAPLAAELAAGDSIAVNGVYLTALTPNAPDLRRRRDAQRCAAPRSARWRPATR